MKIFLALIATLYGQIIRTRIFFYEKGLFKIRKLPARVISIGNITVGGTQKTPLVKAIAEEAISRNLKVCILTRGYGRLNPEEQVVVSDGINIISDIKKSGDEPFELALSLGGKAVIICNKNRYEAGLFAYRNYQPDLYLLDDGFQHLQLARDCNIVCIDASDPLTNASLLPAGRLREELSSLKRATVIALTRTETVINPTADFQTIKRFAPDALIFPIRSKISRLIKLPELFDKANLDNYNLNDSGAGSMAPTTSPKEESETPEKKIFAFCGIGNPQGFFSNLTDAGFEIAGKMIFGDHHWYTEQDLFEILENAGNLPVVTTIKDAVRLKDFVEARNFFAAMLEIEIAEEQKFYSNIFDNLSS
ncbi:MAG TPA: tetraacyldisaccharide 4'-kinase [Pyrinomonadaceae bacterium]|nr:tetraacyldisaccharide 4'-kinase [Pyrinomonadaceae bacterium]